MNKIGLIGYGYWGKKLHEKIKKLSLDVEFICRSKDTYVDKLDSVDWVFVVTPDNTHYRITKTCLEHGKNVFCEKPFTCNVGQAIKLYKLSEKYNVKLYVDDVFVIIFFLNNSSVTFVTSLVFLKKYKYVKWLVFLKHKIFLNFLQI